MRLADDDIRDVLARADEIQNASVRGAALSVELEAVIEAAGQVGIERSAVEQALRERLGLPMRLPTPGELAFAKSTDGKFYVAEVLTASDNECGLRFLRGGEVSVLPEELRPCSLLPGERVVCPWPWWGPWTCTVMSYDGAKRRVTVSDGWGETHTFGLDEVWLNANTGLGTSRTKTRLYATLIGAGATIGAVLGSLLTALAIG